MPDEFAAPRTAPRPFVFVLMPFSEAFDDAYQLAIKPACEAAGAYAERVDEQIFQGSILDRVYNQIAKADIVVADLTGHNPNVFYETGYAHALGKLTILLTATGDDIPFDLKHYPHIAYGGKLGVLRAELEKRVRWHIEHPTRTIPSESLLAARVNNVPLAEGAVVEIATSGNPTNTFRLRIDLHNAVGRELRSVGVQVGLLTPSAFTQSAANSMGNNVIALADDANLHLPGVTVSLLPAGWETFDFLVRREGEMIPLGQSYRFALRLFTDSGFRDLPFEVVLTKQS